MDRAGDGRDRIAHGAQPVSRSLRLLCLPLFLYLLFGRDNRAAAAWLLGGLGRHRLGRRLPRPPPRSGQRVRQEVRPDRRPPAVHRGDHRRSSSTTPAPRWFCVARARPRGARRRHRRHRHLAFGMLRFDVTLLGKAATFLLMFAIPGFMLGASDIAGARVLRGRLAGCSASRARAQLVHGGRLRPEDPRRHPGRPGPALRRPGDARRSGIDGRVRYGCAPMNVPEQLRYSSDHEWVSRRRGHGAHRDHRLRPGRARRRRVRAGADVGADVTAGESFGEIESTKSVSDVYAPVVGHRRRGERRAGRRAAGAQRRPVRRRVDLHHPR